jgi:EpsG family
MTAYIIVIAVVTIMTLLASRRRLNTKAWSITFAALVIFVGLRHKVGMDWNNYLISIRLVNFGSFSEALTSMEPGYGGLLWISGQLGLGIYGANFFGAVIFLAGVFSYARTTPSPWIALLVAIPYLVVVVGMSANRQSIAAGFLLLAVANWSQSSFLRRTTLISLATMFHYSAVFFLLFTLYDLRVRLPVKLLLASIIAIATAYVLQVSGASQTYDNLYITGKSGEIVSEGAIFHIMLNAGPALVWLVWSRYRGVLLPNNLHRQMALLAIALIPAAFIFSTAASRISIYLFPVSMYIFSALPIILGKRDVLIYKVACSGLFILVLVFWLGFSNSGRAYLPYGNYLTVDSVALRHCC